MSFFNRLTGRKKQPANKSPKAPSHGSLESTSLGPYSGLTPVDLSYYDQVLRNAHQQRNYQKEWETLENVGDVFLREGDSRQAGAYYQQALNLARTINDRIRETGSLFSLSTALEKAGEKVRAKQYHDKLVAIARESKGAILSDIGIHLAAAGGEEYLKRGITLFELHLQIAKEEGNRKGEQMALGNLGTAYLSLGYIHRAIDYMKKALVIAEEINDDDGKQAALGSLATAYKNVGDLQKAGKYIDEAVNLSRETGNEYRLSINVFNKARLLVQQGDLERALPLAHEAAEIWGRNRDPNVERAKALVSEIVSSER